MTLDEYRSLDREARLRLAAGQLLAVAAVADEVLTRTPAGGAKRGSRTTTGEVRSPAGARRRRSRK